MTTLEAIYENGIFKPMSDVPQMPKEHDRVTLTIETSYHKDLQAGSHSKRKNGREAQSATRIVDETFGSTRSINRKKLILFAEDEEFSGY